MARELIRKIQLLLKMRQLLASDRKKQLNKKLHKMRENVFSRS
jgi:hypothetical protein